MQTMTLILSSSRLGALFATAGFLVSFVLGQAAPAAAADAAPTLKAGDVVTPEALATATFLKGSAPVKWETDKLYIFECWATWCGPCVGQIPHLNALHQKFKDKGLLIYGMNVWEDDKAKVEEFVKKKGEGMSYAVAYVGKEGAFDTKWLKAAGVSGIPHAFVVKNGKLLFHQHPAVLTDEVVTALLAGGEQEAKVAAKLAADQAESVPVDLPMIPDNELTRLAARATEFGKAGKQKDAEHMLDGFLVQHRKSLADVGKAIISLETMKAYFTAAKDQAGATKYAEKLAANYPAALPMLCDGGVERLKVMMVADMKDDSTEK